MTSPFQTELSDRAAAHAREWEAAHDPSVGLLEVQAAVRRRRRGRGLLAVGAGAACVALVATIAYAALGRAPSAGPAGPVRETSAIEVLAAVDADDLVLTVDEEAPNPSMFETPYSVVVIDSSGRLRAQVPHAELTEALGTAVDDWPSVRLVAVDTSLGRAVFKLDNPLAYVVPHVAVLNLSSGDVIVVDPCTSPLSSINLSRWCAPDPLSAEGGVIDPVTGEFVSVPAYYDCVSADARYGALIAASCAKDGGESFLVTVDPASGEVVTTVPMGLAPVDRPLVAGGELFANSSTTEGDATLVDATGNSVHVGGAAIEGLGVVGDQILIRTSADPFGVESTYGHALGLWSPATDDFAALLDAGAWSQGYVGRVEVLR